MNFGINFTGVTFFDAAPAFPVTGANNGLSMSGTNVVLGQDPGDAANPAVLLNSREIPLSGSTITFLGASGGTVLVGDSLVRITNDTDVGGSPVLELIDTFLGAVPVRIAALDSSARYSAQSSHAFTSLDNNGNGIVYIICPIVDGGVLAATTFGLHVDQQWNNVAVVSSLIRGDVALVGTDAASKLLDLSVNALPRFEIAVSGNSFATIGGIRYTMAKTLTATAVLDFPSTAAGTSSDLTIALANAVLGDIIVMGVPNASTLANGCFTAWVSAAGVVTVRFTNNSLIAALDPASGTFRVSVISYV